MSRHIAALMTVAALALVGSGIAGAYTIDQQNPTTNGSYSMADLGFADYTVHFQEFAPAFTGLDIVELGFKAYTTPPDALPDRPAGGAPDVSVMLQILDARVGGNVLGQTQTALPTDLSEAGQWVSFSFPTQVPLTPGSKYWIRAENLSPEVSFGVQHSSGDLYPDGRMFIGSAVRTGYDMRFREGVTVAPAVPEPGSLLLMAGGLCCLGLWLRRRKTTA